jgi:hypothetical protein
MMAGNDPLAWTKEHFNGIYQGTNWLIKSQTDNASGFEAVETTLEGNISTFGTETIANVAAAEDKIRGAEDIDTYTLEDNTINWAAEEFKTWYVMHHRAKFISE